MAVACGHLVMWALPWCTPCVRSMSVQICHLLSPLFAVSKLLATGLVNLNRVEVLWRPVTNPLLGKIPLFLNIIGAINNSQGENSVRSVFQCLQLVVRDYLPVLPWNCLPSAVETTGKFGSQTQDLNVSLTAIGLMV
ncbi:hypothetical protein OUZ56_033636 [Daphnia magna]|uniref:Mon2 C-terminal domain-containing protein n=1 Tax=Daphnia magna TaxID=35525 RepID=A0ABR0BB88_9CRUS|nr:hypothetical protein OUZ56_033636 [Daphnia magna]